MITLAQLHLIMPRARNRATTDYPHLTAAMHEFGISASLPQTEMFLANVAHETGELRWMEEIASGSAYEGRVDLGNDRPGDGRRFKGRGAFQITGRANYHKYGGLLGVDLIADPSLAATLPLAFRIAGAYWRETGCGQLADALNFVAVVRRINGGLTGLSQRRVYYERAQKVLA